MECSRREYRSGLVTCTILTEEEAKPYREMELGVSQTADMIRTVAMDGDVKQILEITANGINKIRVRMNGADSISD